jgi:hypothetical protein
MKLSTELRNQKKEQEKSLELRSFLNDKDPIEGGLLSLAAEKKLEVTRPVEFISHVQKHFDNKISSFRKKNMEKSSEEALPLSEVVHNIQKPKGHMYSITGDVVRDFDLSSSLWMSNLRSPYSPKKKHTNKNNDNNNSPYSTTSYQNDENNTVNSASAASNLRGSSSALEYFSKQSNNNKSKINIITKAESPKLVTDELLSRRQSVREEKKKKMEELENQKQLDLKYRKEILKQKALGQYRYDDDGKTSIGSSNSNSSSSRYKYHEKLINKYNKSPSIGKLDLRQVTQKAYAEYSVKHLKMC